MRSVFRESMGIARRIARDPDLFESPKHVSRLVSAAKVYEIAKKALTECYAMARHREEIDVLERYERLRAELRQNNASARLTSDDEASH